MKKRLLPLFIFLIFIFSSTRASATPTIIMNFATMNDLNWAAIEPEWQATVKPQIESEILQWKNAINLTPNPSPNIGEGKIYPTIGWSTLMEYMNFPLDTPSENSVYAIKTRRILEVAQDLNFPVFLPLNGFQWWDQLPELYNWWDSDGTHTDPAFFARQKNPQEFTARFIAGYNPDNQWNVEWQGRQTPMKLNYRNWGGGGFRLAPPPDLVDNGKAPLSYRKVQHDRLQVILKEIAKKPDLVLGITIGTEISLNASITPADEFLPYGYRSTQDLSASRAEVVRKYLQDNARLAVITGIPKDKIFTHIWVEAIPGDKRYVAYAPAAFNLYSNPGASFYGFAGDPLSLPDWKKMLTANGNPNWGAVEYSAGTTQAEWLKGLTNTFTNTQDPGSMMIIYNWGEQKNTGAVAAIKSFIAKPLTAPECIIETPSSLSQNFSIDPTSLQWTADSGSLTIIHIQSGITADPTLPDQKFEVTGNSFSLPTLKFGNYTWWAEADGCDNTLQRFSSPQNFLVTYKNPPSTTPWWVNQIISFLH